VLEDPKDIEARSQLSYLGAIALHGFISRPRGGFFPMHAIQHPLSAYFDISHGSGLALILPRWLRYVSREAPDKIIQFGDRVFSMDLDGYHPFEAADRTIDRFDEWLAEVGAWFYLEDLNIPNDPAVFQEMAENAIRIYGGKDGVIDGIKPLYLDDIIAIYKNCARPGMPEGAMERPVTEEAGDPSEREEILEDAEDEIIEEVIEIAESEPLPEGMEKVEDEKQPDASGN
jgi:alcohol dehydrogenase YqhD (iron-dependent ADH family)